jgi:SAM-dependent methyltransferase
LTDTDPRLTVYRATWQKKPVLRTIYGDYYRRITEAWRPGRILEIGGGSGNLKEVAPQVVSTDILPAGWIDAVADAQALPFISGTFDSIVMVDVLHHIEQPWRFLTEAQRVLRSGGRLVLIEPAITPLSGIVYRWFHHEPVRMADDPFTHGTKDSRRDPYLANSAIPTLLFRKYRTRLAQEFPDLMIREVRLLSLIAYPLSGGFRSWTLLPRGIVRPLLCFEDRLPDMLRRLMAFRLLAVLERR